MRYPPLESFLLCVWVVDSAPAQTSVPSSTSGEQLPQQLPSIASAPGGLDRTALTLIPSNPSVNLECSLRLQ